MEEFIRFPFRFKKIHEYVTTTEVFTEIMVTFNAPSVNN